MAHAGRELHDICSHWRAVHALPEVACEQGSIRSRIVGLVRDTVCLFPSYVEHFDRLPLAAIHGGKAMEGLHVYRPLVPWKRSRYVHRSRLVPGVAQLKRKLKPSREVAQTVPAYR